MHLRKLFYICTILVFPCAPSVKNITKKQQSQKKQMRKGPEL